MLTFRSLDDIQALVGTPLPYGEWDRIDQDRVDRFAEVTEDHEWIHVDIERAKSGPYGGTIAHGFLTLSLVPMLAHRVYRLELPGQMVNYGLDTVRFPAAVPTGKRVRSRITPKAVEEHARGHRILLHHEIEVEGQERPGCIADTIFFLLLPEASGL
jgi:acyl dehydratase